MHLHAYRLRAEQPAYRLDVDDVLLGIQYWIDPSKIVVLCRMDDGYRPACNLSRSDLERMDKAEILAWAKL